KATNPVESMISIGRTVAGNVKRGGTARWCCAGLQPVCSKPRSSSAGSTATAKCQSSAAHSTSIIKDLHLPGRSRNNQPWIARSSTISGSSSLRMACLVGALTGQTVIVDNLLPEMYRRPEGQSYDRHSSERRQFTEAIGKVLPIYAIRARAITSRVEIAAIEGEITSSLSQRRTE